MCSREAWQWEMAPTAPRCQFFHLHICPFFNPSSELNLIWISCCLPFHQGLISRNFQGHFPSRFHHRCCNCYIHHMKKEMGTNQVETRQDSRKPILRRGEEDTWPERRVTSAAGWTSKGRPTSNQHRVAPPSANEITPRANCKLLIDATANFSPPPPSFSLCFSVHSKKEIIQSWKRRDMQMSCWRNVHSVATPR